MSSASAKAYNALGRSDVFIIDPRKVVIEEDDPAHPDFKAHEPRRVVSDRMLRLIRTKGASAVGEIGVKLKKLDDGTTITVVNEGRVRVRHARLVLREKLSAMGVDPETWEPSKDDPLPLALRAVPRNDPDTTLVFNSYARRDPPLMIAQKVAEHMKDNVPIEQIEILVNRSAASIKKYEKLWTDAVPEVKDALHADKISFNVAVKLCEKSEAKQREALARILERGAKRGKRAQEAADGAEAKPRPRTPAKLADAAKELPEGPAKAAVEWALGLREELPSSESVPAVLFTESSPADVREIDSLKAEIERLTRREKVVLDALGPVPDGGQCVHDTVARIETLKSAAAEPFDVAQLRAEKEAAEQDAKDLRSALSRAPSIDDLRAKLDEAGLDLDGILRGEKIAPLMSPNIDQERQLDGALREIEKLRAKIEGNQWAEFLVGKIEEKAIEKAAIDAYKGAHSPEDAEKHAQAIEWVANFCAAYVVSAIAEKIDDAESKLEEAKKAEKDIEEREEKLDEIDRAAMIPTDAEIEAGTRDEIRFNAKRNTLDDYLIRNPGARPVAVKYGFVQA